MDGLQPPGQTAGASSGRQATDGDVKRCSKCEVEKPVSDFPRDKGARDGLYRWCKACNRERSLAWYNANKERGQATTRAWKERNPERVRQYLRDMYERDPGRFAEYSRRYREKHAETYKAKQRRNGLRRRYGIDVEAFEKLVARQRGVCWICQQPPPEGKWLCVDHDHETGVIRGMLCQRCNRTLGLYNDDAEWFARAARYLRKKPPTL